MSHSRQATGSARASRTVPAGRSQTDRQKSPKQQRGEAPIYQDLAAAARAAGFAGVTALVVHTFVAAGLIPAPAVRQSRGRYGFTSTPNPTAKDQLLALCEYRRWTRSRNALAVLLWADGWEVPSALLKSALCSPFPARRLRTDDRTLDRLDRLATGSVRRLMRMLRPGHIGQAAHDAAAALAPAMFAVIDRLDDVAAANIERLMGMHRARTDIAPGAPPWLTTRPAYVWNLMLRYAPPWSAKAYIKAADRQLLDRSLAHARFLIYDFPALCRALEARRGRGFGGLHWLGKLGPRHATVVGAVTVVIDSFPAMSARLDALIDGVGPTVALGRMLSDLADEYRKQYPDHRQLLDRVGLEGLAVQGVARPLTGVDDLLARAEALVPAGDG